MLLKDRQERAESIKASLRQVKQELTSVELGGLGISCDELTRAIIARQEAWTHEASQEQAKSMQAIASIDPAMQAIIEAMAIAMHIEPSMLLGQVAQAMPHAKPTVYSQEHAIANTHVLCSDMFDTGKPRYTNNGLLTRKNGAWLSPSMLACGNNGIRRIRVYSSHDARLAHDVDLTDDIIRKLATNQGILGVDKLSNLSVLLTSAYGLEAGMIRINVELG